MRGKLAENLLGRRFARLVVIGRAPGGGCHARWAVRCDCGVEKSAYAHLLKRGKIQSCGCLKRDICGTHSRRHGLTHSDIFKVWSGMITRCTNPGDKSYSDYGGRGIAVCDRWLNSVENFAADMGPRPPGASIDRIDNSCGYGPGNCRWATPLIQGANKRNNNLITHDGRTQHLAAWARELGIPESTIHNRVKAGRAIDDRRWCRRAA